MIGCGISLSCCGLYELKNFMYADQDYALDKDGKKVLEVYCDNLGKELDRYMTMYKKAFIICLNSNQKRLLGHVFTKRGFRTIMKFRNNSGRRMCYVMGIKPYNQVKKS